MDLSITVWITWNLNNLKLKLIENNTKKKMFYFLSISPHNGGVDLDKSLTL